MLSERKKAQMKEYRKKHRGELIAYGREYRRENREKLREFEKKRYSKRKEWIKKYSQKPEVKKRVRERAREYRRKPEVQNRMKEYRQRPDVKERRIKYQKENREHINARSRTYLKKHPEMREHYKEYRKRKRSEIVEAYKKGMKCAICGYNKNPEILQFHHKNPKEKDFNIGNLRNLEKIEAEARKCVLLCPNCHMWLHYKKRG